MKEDKGKDQEREKDKPASFKEEETRKIKRTDFYVGYHLISNT